MQLRILKEVALKLTRKIAQNEGRMFLYSEARVQWEVEVSEEKRVLEDGIPMSRGEGTRSRTHDQAGLASAQLQSQDII